MPKIQVNGAKLHYTEEGTAPETILFAHGLLWGGQMFEAQVNALKDRYRCITFDFRGQGQSEVTQGGYDMETLYQDTVALIEALGCAPCHFAGLSMGGFMGMRLAVRRPELLRSLILLGASADAEPKENIPRYNRLNFIARWFGLRLVAAPVMRILFGQSFLTDPNRAAQREEWKKHLIANHRIGITRAVKGVINRQGVYDEIGKITTPTLILVGEEDVATIPAKAERIQARIAGSRLVRIPKSGHSSTIEEPEAVNLAIKTFLNSL
ncbi:MULTISPECIES: alpha/beta fold hydrolase [Nitrosomonas]|uniref:Alpha/beta hydrolase n=1 Tax=Nitrosomonas communis TaxID=44574 RepID=A0A0F7KF00_9PROT|nr:MULTISPECIES: alpha/beta hydrolase [Nitrosomonas]AKH38061.1 alpha/beta hydrolase [Nitrosomonas communis]TYP88150.1 pimeloyl-ACP methyl ester carboxylesterase [Nitrosomonas communis]UVS59959.1 alpha/beta hydrolase [Nitrosomonas sp. PLL12]